MQGLNGVRGISLFAANNMNFRDNMSTQFAHHSDN
ncbi:MAG: hypothetical protein JWO39_2653 [Gemmatimonadetes bacterium]|jgi:hypothetical protein|nr:hypothetical protein [Gemmatimonadota bacterium]